MSVPEIIKKMKTVHKFWLYDSNKDDHTMNDCIKQLEKAISKDTEILDFIEKNPNLFRYKNLNNIRDLTRTLMEEGKQ